jgi:hypothetical protein
MAPRLELDELVESYTLLPDEVARLRNKSGATRLGFAVLLRFFTVHGRFPTSRGELADEAVEFVGRQVGVAASEFGFYDWAGPQIKAHRAEVRQALGFRECGVQDADKLADWLAIAVAESERCPEMVRTALLERCREERIEPPARSRVDRIVASALHRRENSLFTRVAGRVGAQVRERLLLLVAAQPGTAAQDVESETAVDIAPLAWIKTDPGNVSLDSMLAEIDKLLSVRAIELPSGLFDDVAPKVLAGWRTRWRPVRSSHRLLLFLRRNAVQSHVGTRPA